MKGFQRFLSLAICAGLLLAAGACSQLGEETSSQVSTPSVSLVESEASPTPTPTPTPTPSPSPTPEASSEVSVVPTGDFEEEFSKNPIDAKMEDDLLLASSNTLILQAYNSAASRWETVINTAYADAQASMTGDSLAKLQEEQEAWENDLDSQLQSIRDENSEDSMTAAKLVVEYYRDRAKVLCEAAYEASGEMPEFPSTDGEAVG